MKASLIKLSLIKFSLGWRWLLIGLCLVIGLVLIGLCVGSAGFETGLVDPRIVWEIRLPRTLGAWAAGALLGLAGALAQGLFRNPLADPYLLGSASGASLGVALALAAVGVRQAHFWFHLGLTGAAFVGALSAVWLTLVLSRGVAQTLRLLLSGVVVGVVLGAATQGVLWVAPESLQTLQAFILGSTAFVGWSAAWMMLGVGLPCIAVAVLLSKFLDGLSLGDDTAMSLGLRVVPLRWTLLAVLALCTATAVSQTGLIAFVGLAAPHLVRALVKTTHRLGLVLSSLAGGILLLAADILARGLIAPQELPVGILTAVLGGLYLLWLMHQGAMRLETGS